jgi:cupin superfamily acireductone dioxygenase involved in methionine salvage
MNNQEKRKIAIWLGKHRHPIQSYTKEQEAEGYTKDDWYMRECARQTQIDELLKELGFTKFDVISLPKTKKVKA